MVGSASVSPAVRNRDELSPEEPGPRLDDERECRVSFAVGRIGVGIAPGVGVPDATDREGSWPATERVGQRVATGRDAQLARRGHPKPLPTNPMHHTRQQYTYDQRSTLKLLSRSRFTEDSAAARETSRHPIYPTLFRFVKVVVCDCKLRSWA